MMTFSLILVIFCFTLTTAPPSSSHHRQRTAWWDNDGLMNIHDGEQWDEEGPWNFPTGGADLGNAVVNPDWMWPLSEDGFNGKRYTIPLNMDMRVYPEPIIRVMEDIQFCTCLYFNSTKSEGDRLDFKYDDAECWSETVGRKGGLQIVNIGRDCLRRGQTFQIYQQLLHVAGFFNEEQRVDRDQHIHIMWENIADGKIKFFEKRIGSLVTPYDKKSAMHNLATYLSRDGNETMVGAIKERDDKLILSDLDIIKINIIYPCCKDLMKSCPDSLVRDPELCNKPRGQAECKKTCKQC